MNAIFVPISASSVAVVFDSPMQDLNYEVEFQAKQVGTYDVWATDHSTTGFTMNLDPPADANLHFSYVASDRESGDAAGMSFVQELMPTAWFKYRVGITSAALSVSQWDDASGNWNHLVQNTGTNQPTLEADLSILFDGVDNYLKTAAFILEQPWTLYMLFRQVTWTIGEYVWEGHLNTDGRVFQSTTTPGLVLHAGTALAQDNGLALNTYGVMVNVLNGTSSLLQINSNAPTTGDAGVRASGGFTLGSRADATSPSNIQVKEVIIFSDAHNEATRIAVIAYLSSVGGI